VKKHNIWIGENNHDRVQNQMDKKFDSLIMKAQKEEFGIHILSKD
jgi:hypothetical protein